MRSENKCYTPRGLHTLDIQSRLQAVTPRLLPPAVPGWNAWFQRPGQESVTTRDKTGRRCTIGLQGSTGVANRLLRRRTLEYGRQPLNVVARPSVYKTLRAHVCGLVPVGEKTLIAVTICKTLALTLTYREV